MKMQKRNQTKVINFISDNSISAIISKFEAKDHSFRVKDKINNKMSATETLQSDEVFYDNLVNNSGNKSNIESELLPNDAETNLKTFKNRDIPSRGKSLINLVSWLVFLLSSVTTLALIILLPRALIKSLFYPGYRLLFGTLYPAYASYKAVRTRNVKEYVKWMMNWIVFALFSCTETFTDIFQSWFPFYYEIKVIIVLWLLSPATKGSSTLYRKFVHPMLTKREQEIDEYISQAKEKGYSAVLQYGSRGVNYATSVIMQTALKTIDGIALNKPGLNPPASASSDVPDGPERMQSENGDMFSSTELNQFEISSDDDEPSQGAARSRPVRAVAKKRKTRTVATKTNGRKQQTAEMDDVFIE